MATVTEVYYMRGCAKLPLPQLVQDNIARLRITPMTYRPFHKPNRVYVARKPIVMNENWRESALIDFVRRVREREDTEYSEIFAILNKIAGSTVEKLSIDAITFIQKRDDSFRLRVATLLFDKAVTQHAYASVMAECARIISDKIPDLKEDLQAQVYMFPKLYNLSDTLTFPTSSESNFDNKVIEWMKQKEKRRGYAKFMMELCSRNLVTEECVKSGLQDVLNELLEVAKQPRSSQTEENVGQFATFLFETAKLSSNVFKLFMRNGINDILKTDKAYLPSLNMKSRFKLEDAFKLTQ